MSLLIDDLIKVHRFSFETENIGKILVDSLSNTALSTIFSQTTTARRGCLI